MSDVQRIGIHQVVKETLEHLTIGYYFTNTLVYINYLN
jgi:hypothetical protein